MRAAFKGSREIAFAVIAMTITLAAVYMPIAFQTGTTGRLFTEFALTLAGAAVRLRLHERRKDTARLRISFAWLCMRLKQHSSELLGLFLKHV